jgi:hypothetical protein
MLHHRISKINEDTGRQTEKCERKIREPECSDELEVEPSEESGKEYIILFEAGVSSVLNYVNSYVCALFIYYFHIIAHFCRNVILIFLKIYHGI